MGMGRKNRLQESLWIATQELPRTKGHVFYERVNQILEENRFDRFAEQACQKFYAPVMGRPGVAPGVYFRMLLVGSFEGLADDVPDHSTVSRTRRLMDLETHAQVFNGR